MAMMADLIDNTIKAEWTNADALDLQPTCNQLATDSISRQAAIDALEQMRNFYSMDDCPNIYAEYKRIIDEINNLPSAQPTLHGYNIEHLELIATVLQKEDLPPERVVEALTDIGRIVAIVRDEFEETLRRSLQNIERRTDGVDC